MARTMHGPVLRDHPAPCVAVDTPCVGAAIVTARPLGLRLGSTCTPSQNLLAIGRVYGGVLVAVKHDGRWRAARRRGDGATFHRRKRRLDVRRRAGWQARVHADRGE